MYFKCGEKAIQSGGFNWVGCVRGNINIFCFGPRRLVDQPNNFVIINGETWPLDLRLKLKIVYCLNRSKLKTLAKWKCYCI